MEDYQKHEKEDYGKFGDLSQEEFQSLIRELYALWRSTNGDIFGDCTRDKIKEFLTFFNLMNHSI